MSWKLDCGNATEESEKDAEVENSDYIDEDSNDMDNTPWKPMEGAVTHHDANIERGQ